MFKENDEVEVICNKGPSEYDFLIGKRGYIVRFWNEDPVICFDYDEEWAEPDYACLPEELKKVEKE